MDLSIPKKELEEIELAIQSEESVVGIDAKKTHVIIIHMLHQIQEKLNDLEGRIENLEK
jgi:tetrahydromethanopterin S-methyltransferase subunit B